MTLLLGIDEGTSAVKAVVFDADLRPVSRAGARRLFSTHARVGSSRIPRRSSMPSSERSPTRWPAPTARSRHAASTTRASRCWRAGSRAAAR